MKVYILIGRVEYEGEDILNVYSKEEEAVEAENLMKEWRWEYQVSTCEIEDFDKWDSFYKEWSERCPVETDVPYPSIYDTFYITEMEVK